MSTVRYKRNELPSLTEKRKAELKSLSEQSDSQIDYSDVGALNHSFWEKAVRGQFYRPVKKHASVRIDADVLEWLKEPGKGYQTRLNAILREAMMRKQPLK
ncbi:BrnA antitoxin family protein [Pseudomonas sp. TH21]|uniref:BrnA antitoxin family protein n=1 Tax=Pseudomonas sp. TH21 TaxID=2796387 RepID=UPI001913361B|nr:BrnA antitoxin family protein [Pseudomonas sp. TH21]MBK5480349.1 BrnA antitoxin family protein [Pseudomonas sp. TH21]